MNAPDREAWLAQRSTGIGGSDVAAVLGLSKWRTPLQVYQEKRGELGPSPDNEAMRWGRYLEPAVRQAYADQTGNEVMIPAAMLRHPRHDFMVANIDGFVQDRAGRIFEAKTARTAEGWGEPGSDQIPQAYLLQVQHYMEVTALPVADVAVLIGGADFRVYTVEADHELQEMLIDAEAEFWQRVQRGDPPEPVTVADAVARWGRSSTADLVMADAEVLQAIQTMRAARESIAAAEAIEETAKAIVLRALGERDTLVDPAGRTIATWKAAKPAQRFDVAGFRQLHPDLYAQFAAVGEPSRRFLLK